MDVSIIIVNYNTKRLTDNCIKSIEEKTKDVDYEIILVDNCSTDGSKEMFASDARIRYIYNNENLGFGRANNLGAQYARGKYVFLLNSDTILCNDAVSMLYHAMETLPLDVGCLGTMLLDSDGNLGLSYGRFPCLKSSLRHLAFNAFHVNPKREKYFNYLKTSFKNGIIDVDYITGADVFIRRDVVEKCGLFNPVFFMYYEETEMQKRYASNGFRRCILDGPRIIHLEGACTKMKKHIPLARISMPIDSCLKYFKLWMPWYKTLLLRLMLGLIQGPHYLLNPKFSFVDKCKLFKILYL